MPRKPVFPHPTSTSNDIPRRQSQSQSSQPLPPFPLPLPSALRMGMDQPHAPPQLVSSSNPSQSQSQTQYRTISGSGPAPPSSNYRYETMQEEVYPGGGTGGGGAGSGADSFAASPEEWDELEDINGGRQSPLQLAPGSASGLRNNGSGKERKPIATRRRAVQSCSECRRRKIKCDKKWVVVAGPENLDLGRGMDCGGGVPSGMSSWTDTAISLADLRLFRLLLPEFLLMLDFLVGLAFCARTRRGVTRSGW